MKLNKTGITDEVRDVAAKIGWRQMLFTNKLQLRVGLFLLFNRNQFRSPKSVCLIIFIIIIK